MMSQEPRSVEEALLSVMQEHNMRYGDEGFQCSSCVHRLEQSLLPGCTLEEWVKEYGKLRYWSRQRYLEHVIAAITEKYPNLTL